MSDTPDHPTPPAPVLAGPRRVLITGGSSGIGAAIAARCERDGYEPVIIDLKGEAIHADLSDETETAAALEEALAGGPITSVVNNVGWPFPASVEDQTLAEMTQSWALHVRTSMQCVQALLPGMKEAGFGRIVSLSSRAALGKELRSAYSAAKAGLIGLTRVWALELGQHGITANAIAPGPVATDLFVKANPADSPRTKAIIEGVPVRRIGTPADIAHVASFLLDEDSGFITGQTIYACGGLSIGGQDV